MSCGLAWESAVDNYHILFPLTSRSTATVKFYYRILHGEAQVPMPIVRIVAEKAHWSLADLIPRRMTTGKLNSPDDGEFTVPESVNIVQSSSAPDVSRGVDR